MRRLLPVIFFLLLACASASGQEAPAQEWRGVWLTTVRGTDWPSAEDDAATQQEKLVTMLRALKSLGINAVFFQVVSNQDAVWPSGILPWSEVFTGTQGEDPGYDPLALAVQTCREEGMQIHAWLNPFRCGPADFAWDGGHIVRTHPEYIRSYRRRYYLDPGLPEVRAHLAAIVTELLTRYELDGIHIDDYFYPDGLQERPREWDDSAAWQRYGGGLDRAAWRRANVNAVVRTLHASTHAARPEAVFGVSPAGRLVNTLRFYADPRSWVEAGSVDYLVPQIYWQHGHPVADFAAVLAEWEEVVGAVPMMTGLAAYRYGETGFEELAEYEAQISACRAAPYVIGHVWFPANVILREDFSARLREDCYREAAAVPLLH